MSGVFCPGKMSASLVFLLSGVNAFLYDAFNLVLLDKYTSLFDLPFLSKFISSGTKFDVAPEYTTNFIVHCCSTHHVHLFDFVLSIGHAVVVAFVCSVFCLLLVRRVGSR